MKRACGVVVLVAIAHASVLAGQEPEPRFDVASVRPSADAFAAFSARLAGGRFEARGVTNILASVLQWTYRRRLHEARAVRRKAERSIPCVR